MSWQLFAVICSFSYAFQNVLIKYLSRRKIGSLLILFVMFAAAVPLLLFLFMAYRPFNYAWNFPLVMVFAVGGNLIAFYGYVRAIELADVSMVSPLLSLSPFFMLLTSWIIVSETPDFQGFLGIIAVVIGTYFLSGAGRGSGVEPIKALWRNHGTRWALIVSFIWSIQANIDKLAVQASDPLAYAFWFHVVFALSFTPIFLFMREEQTIPGNGEKAGILVLLVVSLIGVGVLQATMSATQMTAIVMTDVTYVISIKRAGMLVAVLFGGILLDEPYTGRRFLSSIVVLLGLVGIMFR